MHCTASLLENTEEKTDNSLRNINGECFETARNYTMMNLQVNADVCFYTAHENGSQSLTQVNTSHIGKNISTKAVGSSKKEDITLDYKFLERYVSERVAWLSGDMTVLYSVPIRTHCPILLTLPPLTVLYSVPIRTHCPILLTLPPLGWLYICFSNFGCLLGNGDV